MGETDTSMKLSLTKNEVAFFCLMFKKDIPQIVLEEYKGIFDASKIQDQFDSFFRKFTSLKIFEKSKDDTSINEDVQKLFVSIFTADQIVSLLSPQGTECSIFYSNIGISIILKQGNLFDIEEINNKNSSIKIITSLLSMNNCDCDEPEEIVEDAQTVEDILAGKNVDIIEDEKQKIESMSKMLNKKDVSIVTIEDPIEYRMPHVNQSQVNPKIGYTFANGLRAFLRQDPNIIMVGEIRDQETA